MEDDTINKGLIALLAATIGETRWRHSRAMARIRWLEQQLLTATKIVGAAISCPKAHCPVAMLAAETTKKQDDTSTQ
jgi:hypothetical protein